MSDRVLAILIHPRVERGKIVIPDGFTLGGINLVVEFDRIGSSPVESITRVERRREMKLVADIRSHFGTILLHFMPFTFPDGLDGVMVLF